MKFIRFKREYLLFTKKERNAAIIILLCISISLLAPIFKNEFDANPQQHDYSLMKSKFRLVQNHNIYDSVFSDSKTANPFSEDPFVQRNETPELQRTLFYFDPNKITKEEWMQLGISEVIANRIINYTGKGGQFKRSADLLKIYGFKEMDFNAIKEYIRIETPTGQNWTFDTAEETVMPSERRMAEINSSGVAELMAAGFTSELANRIINFRNGLGGIYSFDQIGDVYGMSPEILDAVKPFITIDLNLLQTISLNSCSFEQLAKHSYISDELATLIIDYRTRSGRFVSVSEVMKVKGMYPSLFEKLKPYLTL